MNRTNLEHAGFALLMQGAVWLLTGNLLAGTMLAMGFFFGREHSQAEYKAISTDFNGKRANMPWYAGFNPKYWSLDGKLDILFPILACVALYLSQFALK